MLINKQYKFLLNEKQIGNAYLEIVEVSLTFRLCLGIEIKEDDEGDTVVD